MSIHPSLATSSKDKKQKTVLKRIERIKHMMTKGLWREDSSVFGLPKIKVVKIKVKKEKAAKEATATEGPAAAPAGGTAPAAATATTATPKAAAKPAAGKK